MKKSLVTAAAVLAILAAPVPALGAVITDVQSAFDKQDPFDIALRINYEFSTTTSELLRETLQQSTGSITLANQLEYERVEHIIAFDIEIGLYHDLELIVDLPLVASDQAELKLHSALPTVGDPYAQYLNGLDPSAQPWNYSGSVMTEANATLFDVPFTGKKRKGLGDIGIGLKWAPWHNKRDSAYPSWLIGVMFRIPSADIKKADNDEVGLGLFQVEMNTAISRRVAGFFEPYFDLHGTLRLATSKSLFQQEDDVTQTLVQPGHRMGLKLGAEFIPWEVRKEDRHVAIDIGVGLDYNFEGREYTELFEALGTSPCQPIYGCPAKIDYKAQTMSNVSATYSAPIKGAMDSGEVGNLDSELRNGKYQTDGITDVEHYGIYSVWFGLDVQPIQYLEFGLKANFAYTQNHYITFADAGKDSGQDLDAYVTGFNSDGENEYNPKYIEQIDQIGRRFKSANALEWSLLFSLAGKF